MILQLENIAFGFSSEKQIFKNVSFSLEQGKIYALMGANGAGKTTLFNLITGFHRSQSGQITFKQQDITNQTPYKISVAGIGRTFQDLRLISKLTVKENIVLAMHDNPTDNWLKALLPKNVYSGKIAELNANAEDIITQYFLQDVKNSLAGEISYGQQKLLTIACCVANSASLILLDEPVASINPEYRARIALLLQSLKEQGKTILLIEHNSDFINEVADQIFFLNEGEINNYNSIDQLKNDAIAMAAYL